MRRCKVWAGEETAFKVGVYWGQREVPAELRQAGSQTQAITALGTLVIGS